MVWYRREKKMRASVVACWTSAVCALVTVEADISWADQGANEKQAMEYHVKRVAEPVPVDAGWDAVPWNGVEPLELKHYMGSKPEHFPRVQAKMAYDAQAVYVMFRVDDNYVRAVAQRHHGAVYRDSCVEFFFAPGTDTAKGYFNLEMNCGGTMLLHYQLVPRKNLVPFTEQEIETIDVAHSLPKIVDPEIRKPTTWTVAYRFPVELLEKYFPSKVAQPGPGVTWRANFYKCADATSHPHWLTWAPVKRPRPDFHRPEFFGRLHFE